jgi:ATP-binding cassette, subfamily B, bacterial
MFHGSGWWGYLGASQEKPRVTRQLVLRVLGYARPYRRPIFWMLVMILVSTGLSLLTPLIMRQLIDITIPTGNVQQLVLLALALLFFPLFNGAAGVVQRRLNAFIGEGVIFDLRVSLFAHLQRMSLRFFTNTKVGELMSRLNNDVIGAQNAISNTIVAILTNLITAVAVLIVMLKLEWLLTIIGILILPLFFLAARRMGTVLRETSRQQMDAVAQMNALMNETLNIGGALLVKLFGRSQTENTRFHERASSVRDLGVKRAVQGTIFFIIIGFLSAIGTALVFGLGGYLVMKGSFTIGTIVAFGAYLATLYGALQGLANAPVDFATSMVSFERVFEVIDLPLEIAEKPNALALEKVGGDLVFEHVSFRYTVEDHGLLHEVERHGQMDRVTNVLSGGQKGGNGHAAPLAKDVRSTSTPTVKEELLSIEEQPDLQVHHQARIQALEDINFAMQPGQLTALVGPSGAGKTTLTYLIPRLYDPTQGSIRLDGHDLRDFSLKSLSDQIGMVTQETYLFHDTIRTNLLYARLDATQAEIESAAQTANIHDFIMGLPGRYETVVGERGYRLSGGEKQRLALARVILKNPRLLVLDEATSHLDSESEVLIQEALKRIMADRTSIVIAHRLSTILAADLILVMDRGQVVERGKHAELLAMGGLYARLFETQFRDQRESI